MKSAILITPEGEVTVISPNNGTDFQLEELYKLIGCDMIEIAYPRVDAEYVMLIDEEGKLKEEKKLNRLASVFYGHGGNGVIVGNAVICHKSQFK